MSDEKNNPEKELEHNLKKEIKKELRKERRKERRLRKKEKKKLKKEVKKAAYVELSGEQKRKYWMKRVVSVLVIIGVLIYLVSISWKPVLQVAVLMYYNYCLEQPVEQEKIQELVHLDEKGAARIEAIDSYSEDDTWAIYLYMCGSNLESLGRNSSSDLTNLLIADEVVACQTTAAIEQRQWLTKFMNEIQKQGMDFPAFMYEPVLKEKTEEASEEAAPSDIKGASSNDLDEMFAVELPENIKLVIQTGGSKDWSNTMINPNRSQRFLYDNNGFRQLEDNRIQNMGDGQTFVDFMQYCKDNHPADHTMLLVWNHGGGAFGFGYDENFSMDGITLGELSGALEQVYTADVKNPPFELIGFDACLMATMEVAETLYGYGRYLAASEEIEGGEGWDYTAWLTALASNPGMNGAQVGQVIADTFIEFYAKYSIQLEWLGQDFESTFSVVDLAKAHEVYTAYTELMEVVLKDMGEKSGVITEVSRAARGSIHYAQEAYGVFNHVDLGQFMVNLSEQYPEEAGKVLEKLDEAVLYSRAFSYAEASTGLSVYYPSDIADISGVIHYLEYMETVCENPAVDAVYYYKLAGCMGEEQREYMKSKGYTIPAKMNIESLTALAQLPVTLETGANFSVMLEEDTADLIQDISLCIARYDEENNRLLYYGQDDFIELSGDGRLRTDFNAEWVSVEGEPFLLEIIYATDKVIRYRSPIMWNGEEAYLILSYDYVTDDTSIVGVQKMSQLKEADLLVRKTENLKPGDKIKPLYKVYYLDTDTYETEEGEEVTYQSGSIFKEETLADGKYKEFIRVKDPRGDKYYTANVEFEMKNGKAKNVVVVEGDTD